jgi:hypothetical protein
MNNCVRLENNFDLSALDAAQTELRRTFYKRQCYNRNLDEKFTAVPTSLHALPEDVVGKLLEQLPKAVLDVEVPHVFIIQMDGADAELPTLAAHVDPNRSCGINIYLQANGERTQYYDWDSKSKTLTETEHFVAKQGECWLMNTQVPHSVSLIKNKQRSMLTFSFVNTEYSVIKEALERGYGKTVAVH